MSDRPPAPAAPPQPGLVEAVWIDLVRLHEGWMQIAFRELRGEGHAVLGKWRPRTTAGMAKYRMWSAIGVAVLAVVYPLAVTGFATRFYTRRINRSAASLGIVGVVLLSVLAWGALTLLARFRFSYEGFVAVAAAGGVATISAVLAVLFSRVGGRLTTVVFAYPFAVTAIFLPPVVAALYSPTLAEVVFPRSDLLAVWLLDNVLDVGGFNEYLRARFDLVGLAYVGMWFALAVPVGWVLGLLVSLANLVRPSQADKDKEESTDA